MDKKPGGFLQRIARMPKAIKSAVLSLPIVGATSGNIQAAATNDVERLRTDQGVVEVSPTESPRPLISEARNMRTKILENQGLLKMSESEYDKYFKKDTTRQRLGTANCAPLAAITGLQHSPQLEIMARSSMKRNPDGSWDVSLPLMNDEGKTIRVTQEEMGNQDNPYYKKPNPQMGFGVDPRKQIEAPIAPEGVRALEAAIIKKNYGTDEKGVVRRDKAELQPPLMALDDIAGDNFKQGLVRGPIIKLKTNNGDQDFIMPFNQDSSPEKQAVVDNYLDKFNPETETAVTVTQAGPTRHRKLSSLHAYSLRDTDPTKKTVTLVDPTDTSKTLELSYEEFKKDFSTIQYVRPDHAEILKNMKSINIGRQKLKGQVPKDQRSSLEGIPDQSSTLKDLHKQPLMGAGKNMPPPPEKNTSSKKPEILNKTTIQAGNPTFFAPIKKDVEYVIMQDDTESQSVTDTITQSQPSPSFTPARVLNRQFKSRPIGGGGGRIPSLARRGGNKMMGRLGMQAARMGAQLAAQAAIQAGKLVLNPYVLLAIGIILLLIFIIGIIISTLPGSGSPEEKKVSGTGGSCGPVTYKGTMDSLSDSDARAQLRAAGFGPDNIKAGVSLEGIKQNTICGIINFKNESGLNNIVITSGTDGMHSTRGTYTHKNGFKLDLRINPQIDNYIRSNPSYRQGRTRSDGAAYYIGPRGNGFYREGNHWDIAFTGSNCQNMSAGQIADPNADQNKCEQTTADQNIPENTVLSVHDCTEKWAQDIASNPIKQNFGDPDCDFDQSALYTLLTELDPDQADHWFNVVIKKESGYRPNYYSKIPGGNGEKWGLFQMKANSLNPNSRGDVDWKQQVANAVSYCKELNNKQISCACYWESWGESCNIKK